VVMVGSDEFLERLIRNDSSLVLYYDLRTGHEKHSEKPSAGFGAKFTSYSTYSTVRRTVCGTVESRIYNTTVVDK
jgi:hypothetical protein